MEGHGRESLFGDIDVSRTVGWFTSVYPVFLNVEEASHIVEMLRKVKDQYRQIPDHGIGYGILRYLSKDNPLAQKLQTVPQAEVVLNYLGHFDQALSPASLFEKAPLSTGPVHSPLGERSHLFSINCLISENQLRISWEYSKNLHLLSTIEDLAEAFTRSLRSLIAAFQSIESQDYTPADFPEVELSEDQIEQ